MTEQHRQEQCSTLEWLQGWGQIKAKPKLKARGQHVPKRPRIVSAVETTLQEGLRPSGYTTLSKEALMAAVARRSGRAPDVMRSTATTPEPELMPGAPGMELRYYSTLRAQKLLGLAHPSRQWSTSRTRKEEPVVKTRWLVLVVTEPGSDAVVGMMAPGRPRKQEPRPKPAGSSVVAKRQRPSPQRGWGPGCPKATEATAPKRQGPPWPERGGGPRTNGARAWAVQKWQRPPPQSSEASGVLKR